jgi:hypothetical protein
MAQGCSGGVMSDEPNAREYIEEGGHHWGRRRSQHSHRASKESIPAMRLNNPNRVDKHAMETSHALTRLPFVEETLKAIFEYYGKVVCWNFTPTSRSYEAGKDEQGLMRSDGPLRHDAIRTMSRQKFTQMAVDAGILDQTVTSAQIHLLFMQASGGITRLTFEQFLDAMVLVALAKYGEVPGEGREVVALVKLHEQCMSSFQAANGTDPLGEFVRSLGDDWFDFLIDNNIVAKLYRVYQKYLPREVASAHVRTSFEHHVADQNKAISNAHKAMNQILEDYGLSKVHDFRPIVHACVRDAEKTAIPDTFTERLDVQPPGTFFTFHKFLLAMQKLADYRHSGEKHVQKLAQFLHGMDQCKPFWSKGSSTEVFLPPGFVTFREVPVKIDKKAVLPPEVLHLAGSVFEWYITLGEPLSRSKMPYGKFLRFLRDAGIVKPENNQSSQSQMSDGSDATAVTMKSSVPSPCKHGKELPLKDFHRLGLPNMTSVEAHIVYSYYSRKDNGHFYFEDFLDSCIQIADRIYDDLKPPMQRAATNKSQGGHDDGSESVENMKKFSTHIFKRLLDHLVEMKDLVPTSHVQWMTKEDGEEIADILAMVYEGLEKIYKAYMKSTDTTRNVDEIIATGGGMFDSSIQGWSMRDWHKFLKEFRIHRISKSTLSLNRVFFVYATPINNCCYLDSVDAFVDCVVLVAERMMVAHQLDNSRDRLIWLLHHMHAIAPVTLVSHLRPLFPGLPERPDHRPKPRAKTGWGSVMKTVNEETPNIKQHHHDPRVRRSTVVDDKDGLASTVKDNRKSAARRAAPTKKPT